MGLYSQRVRKPDRMHFVGHQDFRERKVARTDYYERFVHGWKLRNCGACAGSGYYDNTGSPPCGCCGGSGKERYKAER